MSSDWPTGDGWPYRDELPGEVDHTALVDDDVLSLSMERHLLDDLNPLERQVIEAHYGLRGLDPRSMKQLRTDLGVPRADLRTALGSGLAKLRTHLDG
jgi:DNA-directed RNA polymerase sigma subunit (sigma70/sigma32)